MEYGEASRPGLGGLLMPPNAMQFLHTTPLFAYLLLVLMGHVSYCKCFWHMDVTKQQQQPLPQTHLMVVCSAVFIFFTCFMYINELEVLNTECPANFASLLWHMLFWPPCPWKNLTGNMSRPNINIDSKMDIPHCIHNGTRSICQAEWFIFRWRWEWLDLRSGLLCWTRRWDDEGFTTAAAWHRW